MHRNIITRRGFSLIELVVAMALASTVIVTIASLAISSLRLGADDRGRQVATGLAEEAIEAAISLARDRWSELPASGLYHPDVSSSTGVWVMQPGSEVIVFNGISFERTMAFSEVRRARQVNGRTLGDRVASGGFVDASARSVVATVTWQGNGGVTREVTLSEELTRWPMRAWTQSDWSGGAGQSAWLDSNRYASDDGDVAVSGQALRLKAGSGSGPVSGTTPNAGFDAGTTGWTFGAWGGVTGSANGTWVSTGGSPGGFARIRLNDRNRTFGGYWYVPFTVTATTLAAATVSFDWSVEHFSASPTGLRAYVFVDSTSAAPVLGQQVWSSPLVTGTTAWATVSSQSVLSKIPGPGTYYLKVAFYGTFGGGNQDVRVGFDDAAVSWNGTSASAGTTYPADGVVESSTFDTGAAAEYLRLSWNASAPSGTSVALQVGTSADGSGWTFAGPDGTPSSEYSSSASIIHPVGDGRRYVRYRARLRSANGTATPELSSVRLEYSP